jgi:hypothetical protein
MHGVGCEVRWNRTLCAAKWASGKLTHSPRHECCAAGHHWRSPHSQSPCVCHSPRECAQRGGGRLGSCKRLNEAQGYRGLVEGGESFRELHWDDVTDILHRVSVMCFFSHRALACCHGKTWAERNKARECDRPAARALSFTSPPAETGWHTHWQRAVPGVSRACRPAARGREPRKARDQQAGVHARACFVRVCVCVCVCAFEAVQDQCDYGKILYPVSLSALAHSLKRRSPSAVMAR